MNHTLFKATTKSNWIISVIFFVVMFMYLSIIISMFDLESIEGIKVMLETMPKELVAAMGMAEISTDLTSFIANFYYNFIAIMFPIIFCIIVANRLVAKHVDRGSMAYLLSAPNSRLNIVITQALYLIISVTMLFLLLTVSGFALSEAMFPGQLNIMGFLLLNIITMVVFYAISGICFFFSCIFDDTKYSLSFGAGIPIAFFVLNMLANVSERYAWIGNLSLFRLIDTEKILTGDPYIAVAVIIPICIAIITYVSGIILFNRRNLPI